MDWHDDLEFLARLRVAAEAGDSGAQNVLGAYYEDSTVDPAEIERWRKLERKKGVHPSSGELVARFTPGKNDAEAMKWYRRSAESGHAGAQANLAGMYALGRGGKMDLAEAAKWYRKSAAQGYAPAQYTLGTMYLLGDGVKKDLDESLRWLTKAAAQGHPTAGNNLGKLMEERGDDSSAFKWYLKAAESGDAGAQMNVAVMYGQGRGIAQSDTEGVRWLQRSAAQGYEPAKELLRQLQPAAVR